METFHEMCLQLYLVVLTSEIDKNYKSFVGILDYLVVNTTGCFPVNCKRHFNTIRTKLREHC